MILKTVVQDFIVTKQPPVAFVGLHKRDGGKWANIPAINTSGETRSTRGREDSRRTKRRWGGAEAALTEARAAGDQLRAHLDKALTKPTRKVSAKKVKS